MTLKHFVNFSDDKAKIMTTADALHLETFYLELLFSQTRTPGPFLALSLFIQNYRKQIFSTLANSR